LASAVRKDRKFSAGTAAHTFIFIQEHLFRRTVLATGAVRCKAIAGPALFVAWQALCTISGSIGTHRTGIQTLTIVEELVRRAACASLGTILLAGFAAQGKVTWNANSVARPLPIWATISHG